VFGGKDFGAYYEAGVSVCALGFLSHLFCDG